MTATQRRSVVRHARLVDYEPRPGTRGDVDAAVRRAPASTQIPTALAVIAPGAGRHADHFETGLRPARRPSTPPPARTCALEPASRASAAIGSTTASAVPAGRARPQMWVLGRGFGFIAGQALLIETQAAIPPTRRSARSCISSTTGDEEPAIRCSRSRRSAAARRS